MFLQIGDTSDHGIFVSYHAAFTKKNFAVQFSTHRNTVGCQRNDFVDQSQPDGFRCPVNGSGDIASCGVDALEATVVLSDGEYHIGKGCVDAFRQGLGIQTGAFQIGFKRDTLFRNDTTADDCKNAAFLRLERGDQSVDFCLTAFSAF